MQHHTECLCCRLHNRGQCTSERHLGYPVRFASQVGDPLQTHDQGHGGPVTGSALCCSCYNLARKGKAMGTRFGADVLNPAGLPFRAVSPSSSLCLLSLGAALQLESDLLPSRSRSGAGNPEPLCQLGCLGSSRVTAGSQLFRSCRWKVPLGALYTLPGLIPCSRQDCPHPSAAFSRRMLKPGVASRRLSCPKQRDFCLGEPGERRSIPPPRWLWQGLKLRLACLNCFTAESPPPLHPLIGVPSGARGSWEGLKVDGGEGVSASVLRLHPPPPADFCIGKAGKQSGFSVQAPKPNLFRYRSVQHVKILDPGDPLCTPCAKSRAKGSVSGFYRGDLRTDRRSAFAFGVQPRTSRGGGIHKEGEELSPPLTCSQTQR